MSTVTVPPASAEPEMIGVVVVTITRSVGDVTTGAAGGTVSTVKLRGPEALLLPAASAVWTVTPWSPWLNGAVGVKVQRPVAFTAAVPATTPSRSTITVPPRPPNPR